MKSIHNALKYAKLFCQLLEWTTHGYANSAINQVAGDAGNRK